MNKKVKIISLVFCIILVSVVFLREIKVAYGEEDTKHGVLVNIDGIDRIVFENKEDITFSSKIFWKIKIYKKKIIIFRFKYMLS